MATPSRFYLVIEQQESEDGGLKQARIRQHGRDKNPFPGFQIEEEVEIPQNRKITDSEEKALQRFVSRIEKRSKFRSFALLVLNPSFRGSDFEIHPHPFSDDDVLSGVMDEVFGILQAHASNQTSSST